MEQEQLIKTLEAILFVSGKPLKTKELSKILEIEEPVIKTALEQLFELKKDGGIVLLESNGEYQLTTNSNYSTAVKNFLNAELREKLTDATVEVLAIIAYRQPISKAEIEAIRGVSSQYSLRNLLIRGMIEKVANPGDARSVMYQTTTEFLMHLGLNSVKDLPEFNKLVENIKLPETPGLNPISENTENEKTPTIEVDVITKEPLTILEVASENTESLPPIIEASPVESENSVDSIITAVETEIEDEPDEEEEEFEDDDEDDDEE